jgi:hypothetical protein
LSLAAIHALARNAPRAIGASASSVQSDFALNGQICPLVIGADEFRPGQRNDDLVALQFDVEFVIAHHQADTNELGHSSSFSGTVR